jgi:antitoxin component YwqK of YwqJK toxin-antitoxin module
MNIKPLKATILRHFVWPDKVFFNVFLGTIISFTLSFYISNYLYFLSIPLLLLCLHLLRLSIVDAYDDYLRYCRDEEYMSDGSHTIKKENRKYIVNLLNGKRHGSFIEYFINGQIKLDYNYKNGEIEGVYKSYYENGQIEKNCNYINGKFDGPYKSYYENGNLMDQLHYKNGNKDGQFQSFYDNKAKYREGNFGEKELVKEYFKNGNLKFLKENNKYTFYDKDYNLKCEIHSTGNDFIGTWKNYREDGTIEYELDFDDTNSDVKNNKVSKAIFTKGGDFYTKITVSYQILNGSHLLFSSDHLDTRREGGSVGLRNRILIPGYTNWVNPSKLNHSIELKPINSIEDIIEFY